LLTNACKYTVQGSVTVTVRHDPAHWVELAVADTGIGMTTAQLAQLFTPFYRADSALRDSEPGTGLGLTIVKALVELHHGTITVQSEDGIGTIVTCRLPVEQPQAQETTPEVLHERAVGQ
jgi:two-component system, OmpR family, phosphate regulon sensor histidine kinase PhoR